MFAFNAPMVNEIAPDVFRFSLYAPEINLQFNFFLVRDEQPLLFTTGFRARFPVLRKAVATVIDPAKLRWIGFSHFESDECGRLNLWLDAAPHAVPICGMVSAMVNVNDFAARPAKGMADGEVLDTGRYRFQFCATPQLPPRLGRRPSIRANPTDAVLFGPVPPGWRRGADHRSRSLGASAHSDEQDASRPTGKLRSPTPPTTGAALNKLAGLNPKTLAVMHGSSLAGDGAGALRGLGLIMRDVLGRQSGVES